MKLRFLPLFLLLAVFSGQAQITKAQISFATSRVEVSEGDGSVLIEIRRTRVLDTTVSVQFSIPGSPKHCVPTTNLVEFATGVTNRFVSVALVDDDVVNQSADGIIMPEEFVNLTLTRTDTNTVLGANPTMALVIQDNDRIAMGLRKYPAVWDETNGVRMLQANRTGGLGKTAEVSVVISLAGSSSNPTTFEPLNPRLTFLPGVTNLDVPVVLRRDYLAKADERLRIRLVNPVPANSASAFPTEVTIRNLDSKIDFGNLPTLTETNGAVVLPLFRWGPTNLSASVELITWDDTAKVGRDYQLPSRIEFLPGQREAEIPLRLLDNGAPDGARSFRLILANPTGATELPEARPLSIADDEAEPLPVSQVEVLPEFSAAGFDSMVTSLRLRPDGRLLVAGLFSKFGEAGANSVTVLNPDGSLDTTFNSGSGPVGSAKMALPLSGGRTLVLGGFTAFSGQDRKNAARLLADGSVDPDYRLDLDVAPDAAVSAAGDGWWLGGNFSMVNGQTRKWLVRLLSDGTLDPTWHAETNLTERPRWLAGTTAGGLVHSGGHTAVPGGNVGPRLVRILTGGALDTSFEPQWWSSMSGGLMELADGSLVAGNGQRWLSNGTYDLVFKASGMAGTVFGMMPDGSILLARAGKDGNELRRLRMDGSGDVGDFAWFDFGSLMETVTLPDESVVVTGFFTAVNGQPRQRIARLRFPEPTATTVSWHGRRFGGEEDHGPIRVSVLRRGDLATTTTVAYASRPLEATPGKDYENATGSVTFAPGERLKFVELTPLADDEFEPDEALELVLNGEAVDSDGAVATVVLQSDEARVHFATAGSVAVEGGTPRTITIRREGGLAYPTTVKLDRSGTATQAVLPNTSAGDYRDFGPVEVVFAPEQTEASLTVSFDLNDDRIAEGKETIRYQLQVPAAAPHPVTLTDFSEHVVSLADNEGSAFARENLSGSSGLFARVGGGLWLQTAFGRAAEFLLGPTALTVDGAPDPEFVLRHEDAGFLLQPLTDGRTVVSQFVGSSPASFTNRILRLLPNGQRDPAFTPMEFPDSQTVANDYAPQYSPAVAADGSLAAVTWEPGTRPTARTTRGFVIQRFTPAGGAEVLWSNTELMGSGNFGSTSPAATGPLPAAAFLESGSLLLSGRMQFRWQTNSGIFNPATTYPVRPLVRVSPDGVVDPDYFVTLSRGWVRRLVPLPGDRCLIAGDFYRVNGQLRPGLARLLPDGNVDLAFDPELPSAIATANQVGALAAGPNGQVWVSLSKPADGSSRVIGLDAQGKALPGFVSPVFNGPVFSLVPLADGKVVASGYFDQVGEAIRLNYAWLDTTGNVLPASPLALDLVGNAPDGSVNARWGARFSGPVTLESSVDFRSWSPVKTFEVSPGEAELTLPSPGTESGLYFRLHR